MTDQEMTTDNARKCLEVAAMMLTLIKLFPLEDMSIPMVRLCEKIMVDLAGSPCDLTQITGSGGDFVEVIDSEILNIIEIMQSKHTN